MSAASSLTAQTFSDLFGPESPLFAENYARLRAYIQAHAQECDRSRTEWAQSLPPTFPRNMITEELFAKHAYLVLLIKCVLVRRIIRDGHVGERKDFPRLFRMLEDRGIQLPDLGCYEWVDNISSAVQGIMNEIKEITPETGDLFQVIYQQLVSPATRHALGEFYTPSTLACLMVEEVYRVGDRTLDPACGSGTFLVEIISHLRHSKITPAEQIRAIGKIYGFDVHPLAVLVTMANVILQAWDLPAPKILVNVSQVDFLFIDPSEDLSSQFDLILGNPPWLVLNGIPSLEYKNYVKDLARQLGIMMGGKYATHTELSALFYYRGNTSYLKDGGRIFFVATAGLMTGDQHAKFRQFHGMGNIFAWTFEQDLFRIHSICLGLQKVSQTLPERLQVQVVPIHAHETSRGMELFKGAPSVYVPCNLPDITSVDDPVLRLIPTSELSRVLPRGLSPYTALVYQGASLVPRNFLVVTIVKRDKTTTTIHPNETLQEKPPWTHPPYVETKIETEYLFPAARSLELVPFKLLATLTVFLPIERENFECHLDRMKPLARAHFAMLGERYKTLQKAGASITDLWSRINYNKGVTNPGQRQQIKVIFPGSGTILKAAVVEGEVIIDTTCYYYPATSLEEADYLVGVLNSRSISQDLGRRGSTGAGGGLRHYHKKPLEYNIPRFNLGVPLHLEIARKSAEMKLKIDRFVQETALNQKENGQKDIAQHPRRIQNAILRQFVRDFEELDALVLSMLTKK